MSLLLVLFFILMVIVSIAHEIKTEDKKYKLKIKNNCPFTIWPGIQGNPGRPHLANGGFPLSAYSARVVRTPSNWAGKIWGRTDCNYQGKCVTGDCGNGIECNGAGGVPPVSIAEITFQTYGGRDFYDVSLVDGYNLPIKMVPAGGFGSSDGDKHDCKSVGCTSDLNAKCPPELAVKSDGRTVACMSACARFDTDAYCCRNAHNTPQTCKSSSWPKNYLAVFKSACPNAYTYAYDDTISTFACSSNLNANYDVVFCP